MRNYFSSEEKYGSICHLIIIELLNNIRFLNININIKIKIKITNIFKKNNI